jgi:two-component system phosphate regulon sensor histidine kinase PhoR
MSKKIIWAIVGLMSIALLGLVVIQAYWISWSFNLEERRFNDRVEKSLAQISTRLENAVNSKHANTLSLSSNLKKSFSRFSNDSTILSDILPIAQKTTNPLRGKSYYEMLQAKNIMNPISLEDKIDLDVLNKLIKQEFKNKRLPAEFDYGVYSLKDSSFVIVNDHFTVTGMNKNVSVTDISESNLMDSPFFVKLFESDLEDDGVLKVFFRNKGILSGNIWKTLLGSIIFTGLVLFCFAYTVYVIFQQKKVSEMKTDFINNMTHEFKTPIATISLAADSITSPMIADDKKKVGRFAGIIKQENKRMLSQVEKVLQMALIDKSDFNLKVTEIDLHPIIAQALDYIKLQVVKRNGEVSSNLQATNPVIEGDQTHISNIIHNLLDNANKYSPDNPKISVETRNLPNGVEVIVKDNGIGMNKEAKKHIFDKFYRVHTGNLHDVKGFGLGLSYVKAMITAHKGQIDVKSELGEGSSFILFFPHRHNM